MNVLRALIDKAVADAIAEHPKLFAPKAAEKARGIFVRKIMATFNEPAEESTAETSPDEAPFIFADPQSREARGYKNLRLIAGASPPRVDSAGRVIILRAAYRESVFALADIGSASQWAFLTETRRITAWREFFNETLPDTVRRSIQIERNGQAGILVPDYWPPSVTGMRYQTPEAA